jgi:hypothetical protein
MNQCIPVAIRFILNPMQKRNTLNIDFSPDSSKKLINLSPDTRIVLPSIKESSPVASKMFDIRQELTKQHPKNIAIKRPKLTTLETLQPKELSKSTSYANSSTFSLKSSLFSDEKSPQSDQTLAITSNLKEELEKMRNIVKEKVIHS